jgi:hypothetical protein
MESESTEGGNTMEEDSTGGGLRSIPRAYTDRDVFVHESMLRAIMKGTADDDQVTQLLNNTLDPELAGVLWKLHLERTG